jgi:Argonaute linker 2 domain
VRRQKILSKKKLLAHEADQYLAAYGLGVAPSMLQVDGRQLPDPQLAFGNNRFVKVGKGDWDARTAVFKQESIRILDIVNGRASRSSNGGSLFLPRNST